MFRPTLFLTASLAVLALTACKPDNRMTSAESAMSISDMSASDMSASDMAYNDDALPLTTQAEDTGTAPAVQYLPPAPAPQVVYVSQPDQSYEYVDDAYSLNDAFADAPPDYSFDYDGVRPWAWRAADGAMRLIENTTGGERYYYYQPGASDPYLVRDADYSYAYSGGRLVSVYDARGQALAEAEARRRADYAGRYLARARALEVASRQQHREQVNAANWAHRQADVQRSQQQWRDEQARTQAWQAWRARHEDRHDQWNDEHRRRQQAAADFHRWQQASYQGPPPAVVVHNRQVWLAANRSHQTQAQIDARQRQEAIDRAKRQQAYADAVKDRRDDRRDDHHDRVIDKRQDQAQIRAHDKAQAEAKAKAEAKQHAQAQKQAEVQKHAAAQKRAQEQAQAEDARKKAAWHRQHDKANDKKAPAVADNDRPGRHDGGHR